MNTEITREAPSPEGDHTAQTIIYYYTGTGNSMWIARQLALDLGGAEIISMVGTEPRIYKSPVIGLVFPVHIWGVPRRVLEFLGQLPAMNAAYIFAIANNGGQVANTLVQLEEVMQSMNLCLAAGWSVEMPSNYIPWGGPGSPDEQNRLFAAARQKISSVAHYVEERAKKPVEKGPLWQRITFTRIYNTSFHQVPEMDKKFWVDERCNLCGICVKVCPAGNISIDDEKLTWHNHCEQCLACIQWCPQEALQYGKKTPAYQRYHHPEIRLQDLLK